MPIEGALLPDDPEALRALIATNPSDDLHPYTLHPRPDGIFAICHREATKENDPRARKYFLLEVDRGTMPIERPELHQTSILRKLLTYAGTHRIGIHRDRFAMNNMRVLFVGTSRRRSDAMIRAVAEHLTGIASTRHIRNSRRGSSICI